MSPRRADGPDATPPVTAADESSPLHLFLPTFRIEECLAEIRECLEKGWTGLGYKTVAFEAAWKAYSGLPHAHFVASATAGLHLAVAGLKHAGAWSDGDEVVTTPLTFVSTNHVILHERLQPVFADVDASLCLDPASVEARITPRTRAVMFVGMGGNSGQLGRVAALCRARGLKLILDAAHMAGTRVDGAHVGSTADAAVFSFHAVKNLPTADGGMVCFRERALDEQARKWSWLGIDQDTYTRTQDASRAYRWRYDVEHLGFKYHGNSIMAALGLVGLRYLDDDNRYRRELAAAYDDALGGVPGVATVPMARGCEPSRHLYQILTERRDALMVHLNARGIFPGVHYRDNTAYPMYRAAAGTCPRAARASETLISLPLHLRMERRDVERVASAIREFVA
jgi:dTDP-4-amino-4,6-dideoxygalactose transaminase